MISQLWDALRTVNPSHSAPYRIMIMQGYGFPVGSD